MNQRAFVPDLMLGPETLAAREELLRLIDASSGVCKPAFGAIKSYPPSTLLLASQYYSMEHLKAVCTQVPYRWIHLTTSGYDFFPLNSVKNRTVVTRTIRAYVAPIAEYCLAAAMANTAVYHPEPGICDRKVGVVGYGPIGTRVAQAFNTMDCDVRVLTRNSIVPQQYSQAQSIEELCGVDYLIICVPLTSETDGLVSRTFLNKMKRGAHIINVARGEIIDQEALIENIVAGRLTATLDVTVPEPVPASSHLRELRGLTLTSHTAWRSGPRPFRYLDEFVVNCERIAQGLRPFGILRSAERRTTHAVR